jgi:hypothetical protein
MVESAYRTGFGLEALPAVWFASQVGGQNFDGDEAAEAGVASAPHLSHAAFPQLFNDLVATERAADH